MTQDKGPNSEIALTFYAVFRRFEIALRKAGYSNAGGQTGRPSCTRSRDAITRRRHPSFTARS